MQRIAALILLLILFGMAGVATAVPVKWEVSGRVDSVNDALLSKFSVGDSFSAELTFDSDTPDAEPLISYRGKYEDAGLVVATVNGYTASADQLYITILNDFNADGRDQFLTSSTHESVLAGDDIGLYSFSGFNMSLRDDHGSMFSSIDIPETPILSSLIDSQFLYLNFQKPLFTNVYLGASVSVGELDFRVAQPVPEPSTVILFGIGLLTVFSCCRNKE